MALSRKLKKKISDSFSKIKSPVEVMFFVSGKYPRVEKQMETALKEILSLNKKLKLSKYKVNSAQAGKYEVKKGPAIVIHGKERGKVRFFGFPSGYLFPIFVLDILEASGVKQKVGELSAIKAKRNPKKKTNIEVFAMPSENYSPIAVKVAHDVALLNPNVTADAIDALLFPELVRKYGINEMPTTVINGKRKIFGVIPFHRLVYILGKK